MKKVKVVITALEITIGVKCYYMYILHLALLLTKKDKLKEFSFIIDNKLLFSNFSLRSSMEILYF